MLGLDKALKGSLILIEGDEDVLRKRALDELLSLAQIGPDDLDFEVFDGSSSNPMSWVASAGTAPFLADRRTLVVRHLLNCDPDSAANGALGKLPPSGLLILVADEETGSDDRLQRLKTVQKNWVKVVQKAGGTVLSYNLDPKSASTALKAEVAKSGKRISEQGVQLLLEMCGNSLSRSIEELEKLILFVGSADTITERDIRAVAVPSREWNVFKMTDAVASNQVSQALQQLRILIGSSSKAEDAAFRSILPMFSRNLRLLWQARICLDRGVSVGAAPADVLACFPDKPNLAKEPPYRHAQMLAVAKKTTLPRVGEALRILSDTDARLKGALAGFSAMDTLERMVLEMAQALGGT
jgi:DNA polymerase III delta subunit